MDIIKYYELVAEAQSAADEIDDYDVESSDAESAAHWQELLAAHKATHVDLVAFVAEHHVALAAYFQDPVQEGA